MDGGRSTGTRWAALGVVALTAVAGCGSAPAGPLLAAPAAVSVAELPPGLLDELADRAARTLPAVAVALPAADAEALVRRARGGSAWSTDASGVVWPADAPGSVWSADASGWGAVPAPAIPAEAPPVPPDVAPAPGPVEAPPLPPDVAAAPEPVETPTVYPAPTTAPVPAGADANGPAELVPAAGGVSGQRVIDAVRPVLDAAPPPPALVPLVRVDLPDGGYAYAEMSGLDPAESAVGRVRQFAPDVVPWIAEITTALAGDDAVAPLLRVDPGPEAAMVTAHGRAHLALALVVAAIVVPAADPPFAGTGPDVVVGAALDAAAGVLASRPMPDGHAEAERDRRVAEYRPGYTNGTVQVEGHRFGLLEGPLPAPGEPANGLVTVVPGGLVVRTGAQSGPVPVTVRVLPGPPGDEESERRELATWHEVVELSYVAQAGWAGLVGAAGSGRPELTPPMPGPLRARVSARGRDDGDRESYEIAVWAAPAAPERMLKATDRLGHRLRGEPEPPVVVRPESAYRWLRDSSLVMGATVTVATGSSVEQVVEAFGGDPAAPVPLDDDLRFGLDPWVAVLPAVDGAVLAVEPNGWQGANDDVLAAVSARGRAAALYWSTDGGNALAFARDGAVVHAFDPLFFEGSPDPEVRAALDGVDWVDYTDLDEKGLVAVERFTGRGIGPEDVARVDAATVAYRIPEAG